MLFFCYFLCLIYYSNWYNGIILINFLWLYLISLSNYSIYSSTVYTLIIGILNEVFGLTDRFLKLVYFFVTDLELDFSSTKLTDIL